MQKGKLSRFVLYILQRRQVYNLLMGTRSLYNRAHADARLFY